MRKDIEIPKVENVQVVAIKEWDKDFQSQNWNVYVLNTRESSIETVLVLSRGNNKERKTTTLRHNLGNISAGSMAKVEYIAEEVLSFTNEYLVTFFTEGKLYEKHFVFKPHSISDSNIISLTPFEAEGVKAQ